MCLHNIKIQKVIEIEYHIYIFPLLTFMNKRTSP